MKVLLSPFNRILSLIVSVLGGPSMLKFLFRRILAALPVIFAVMAFTFGLSQAMPSGPFDAVNQRPMPPHVRSQLEQRYGLDKPVFFNLPGDGKAPDTVWGDQVGVKGGFQRDEQGNYFLDEQGSVINYGIVAEGNYEEIKDGGFSVYREYGLVRWDPILEKYVDYAEFPYRDWANEHAESAVMVAQSASLLTTTLGGLPTPALNLNSQVLAERRMSYTVESLDNYKQACALFRNAPGWSLVAERQKCKTVGGTTDRIDTEATNVWQIDMLDTQFWGYFWNALRLDFGPSLNIAKIRENRQVIDEIGERLPVSFQLGIFAVMFGFTLGIPLGVIAALNHNRPGDYVATFFAVLGQSVPNIVLAPILIIIFTVEFDILPDPDPLVWRDAGFFERLTNPDFLRALILPVVSLGTGMSAGIARLTRASLLQVLNEDYIRTARAKGLRERTVIYLHALKNSLIPVATILGPLLAAVLTGTFIVELIFLIPGLGQSFITGVAARDYTTIMGVTLLYSVFLITGNILVDIIYTWLDPRIRFD